MTSLTKQTWRNLAITGLLTLIFTAPPLGAIADSTPETPDDEPYLFIGIALSGGGFRSAAFSYGALAELKKMKLCVYKERASEREDSVKVLIHESPKTECQNPDEASYSEIVNGNILESADAISAVSGGAIAGAYYALNDTAESVDWGNNFRREVLHRIDKFKNAIVPGIFDFLGLFGRLIFEEGVIDNSKTIKYYDGLYEGKTVGSLENVGHRKPRNGQKSVPLLIQATDLTTESIFTFAENDLKCITKTGENWRDLPVSKAIGASSALPGLIAPVKLPNNGDPAEVGEECNRFFGNKSIRHDVVLVDGGIYDNLAVDGLLRYFVNEKRSEHRAAKDKALILVFNAETTSRFTNAGADTDQFPVAQVLNQSIGLLMNSRVDVSKSLFSMLETTGIKVIDISFQDLINDTSLRHLWEKRAADLLEVGNTFDAKSAFEVARMQVRDIEDLNSVRTMFPDVSQIDAVIAAGSLATRYSLHRQLSSEIVHLLNRNYSAKCSGLLDISTDYCWPSGWLLKNPFETTMKARLSEVQAANEEHLQHHLEVAKDQLGRFFKTLSARLHRIDDPEQEKEFFSPEYNAKKVKERIKRPFLLTGDKTSTESFLEPVEKLLKGIPQGEVDDLESSLKLAKDLGLIDGKILEPSSPEKVCKEYKSVPHCYSLIGILYMDAAIKASDKLHHSPPCEPQLDRDCKDRLALLNKALLFKVKGKALLAYAARDREDFKDAQAAYMYSIVRWLDGQAKLEDAVRTYRIVKEEVDALKTKVDALDIEAARNHLANKDYSSLKEQYLKSQDFLKHAINQSMYFAAITGEPEAVYNGSMAIGFEELIKDSKHDLATMQIEEMEEKISLIALKQCLAKAQTETSCGHKPVSALEKELEEYVKKRKRVEEDVNTFTSTKLLYEYVVTIKNLQRAVKGSNFDEIYETIGKSFTTLVALRASKLEGKIEDVMTGLNFSQTAIRWLGEEEAFLGKLPSHFHTQAK